MNLCHAYESINLTCNKRVGIIHASGLQVQFHSPIEGSVALSLPKLKTVTVYLAIKFCVYSARHLELQVAYAFKTLFVGPKYFAKGAATVLSI